MAEAKIYGAVPAEWDHWAGLGLGEDLLPVVSAPGFAISDDSRMKSIGKTPSRFNARGVIAGIAKWTAQQSSEKEIAAWRNDRRLGIAIQTRRLKAIDIDVNNAALVEAIMFKIYQLTGKVLPVRGRGNSGKAVLVFWCDAYMGKRTVREAEGRGVIEFLGNGQQFIAIGAHWSTDPNEPSGGYYTWEGGLPTSIPVLTKEEAEAVWAMIVEFFGEAGTATGGADRERRRPGGGGEKIDTTDRAALFLEEQGLVLEAAGDKLFVECPWKGGHSGDSGITEAAWLIGGTGGYEQGHFECLHASCKKYSDQDFLAAVGYLRFEPLVDDLVSEDEDEGEVGGGEDKAIQERNSLKGRLQMNKQGRFVVDIHNLKIVVASAAFTGWQVRYDEAIDDVTVTNGDGFTRPVTDYDLINLRGHLEGRNFSPIGREAMRDAVDAVARVQVYDSYIERVRSLVWDGVPRVERFLLDYLGCADTRYHRAVGMYWWTAMAGRLLVPGVQADMAPVMLGDQGLGKSRLLMILANSLIPDSYREIDMGTRDNDTARRLRGALLGELAELRGIRSRDADSIKAWMSRPVEDWVPKFREKMIAYRRRCIFVGTTNTRGFLDDPTGERRWLPFEVLAIDREAAQRDALQLWAEGVVLFDKDGVAWAEAERLATLAHGDFKVGDAWQDAIEEWLGATPEALAVSVRQVAVQALGFDTKDIHTGIEMRIGKILQNCGFLRVQVRDEGVRRWVYRRLSPLVTTCEGEVVTEIA